MSVQGRWRVVETPGYDMAVRSAYILFDHDGGEFTWDGNDEMDEAGGHDWADGSAPSSLVARPLLQQPASAPAR